MCELMSAAWSSRRRRGGLLSGCILSCGTQEQWGKKTLNDTAEAGHHSSTTACFAGLTCCGRRRRLEFRWWSNTTVFLESLDINHVAHPGVIFGVQLLHDAVYFRSRHDLRVHLDICFCAKVDDLLSISDAANPH